MGNRMSVYRLSAYSRALKKFRELGYVKIFSKNIANTSGVTEFQVRKDFSLYGITGNKRGGYIVEDLISKIDSIFGKNKIEKVILIGCGSLGSALLKYRGFEKEGMQVAAGFDEDSSKQIKINNIVVYPMSHLQEFIRVNMISAAVLAVPGIVAQEISSLLIKYGILGILNFAPVNLTISENSNVSIINVNVATELENLLYHVNSNKSKIGTNSLPGS
ncbi:MAG: hypothetical protein A2452_06585 [Candidatus Firestonebacteria bacterium RIFOXYC2_FULL_39_67]|nr:MAG: hypothetical protein A2452_06585 [Candidatus Firestonebacteria bacterium RIFOXYC2_FULL_39_67]